MKEYQALSIKPRKKRVVDMSLYGSPVNTEIIIGNDSNPLILQNTEVIIVYNGYQLCKKSNLQTNVSQIFKFPKMELSFSKFKNKFP